VQDRQTDRPAGSSLAPTQVLVPIDGSPLAAAALDYALEVFECPLVVLNVVTPIDAGMSESGVLEREDRHEEARERARRLTEAALDRAGTPERPVEIVVEAGDPADQILAHLEDSGADHVVMGGHGGPEAGAIRRLLGTVATAVVGKAPVPVTVVREVGDAAES
jgi:nucleotide-binding universal stress UspA family protein